MTREEMWEEFESQLKSEVRTMPMTMSYDKSIRLAEMGIKDVVERWKKVLEQEPKWIPISERLPEDLEPVNITWVNHNPESYYTDIKDKPFIGTGHYCNGRWWWYSVICQDYLNEYGRCAIDAMDDDIEVIAWMPLPESYKAKAR